MRNLNRSFASIHGRIFPLIILALSATLLQPHKLWADTTAATPLGSAFTFQGLLLTSNAPTSSLMDLQFTLFDQSSGGIQIAGPLTRDNVAVTNGIFNVQLDFGTAAFNGDNRFISIGVRPGSSTGSFTLLSPRTQVTATPYALYALKAATVSGTVNCARRKYYMTSSTPNGAGVLTACVAGYHTASFAEIMDPSHLEYAMDLVTSGDAHTLPDSGQGPPFSTLAFIRVGVTGSNNNVPGNANCNPGSSAVWTSASSALFGTVVALNPVWTDPANNVSPWDATVRRCDNPSSPGPQAHVWCVQD